MPTLDNQPEWVKSSLSIPNGNCVEVANLSGGEVGVRNSRDAAGPVLRFMPDEWHAFLGGVRNGEFDPTGRKGHPSTQPPRAHALRAASQDQVFFTRRYAISESQESAVVIGMRDYDRLIQRLDGCKPGGWADLWLTIAGAAAALGVGALVGGLTLPPTLSATVDVLWALVATGATIFCLCIVGYLTQRRNYEKEIGELSKDLEIHLPDAAAISDVG
jgi:hypothetical protein